MLPREWWRLSLLWLFSTDQRESKAKPRLFQNSVLWAALGLALGVGALSVTLAITTGFENTFARVVATAQGDLVHYTRWLKEDELHRISKLAMQQNPQPVAVEYFWKSHGLIVGKRAGRGILIEGRSRQLTQDAIPDDGLPTLILGEPLAEFLGVQVGDQVRILLPGLVRASVPFLVEKIMSYGMFEIDSRYVSLDDAKLRRWLQLNEPDSYEKRPGDAFAIRYFMDSSFHRLSEKDRLMAWTADYENAYLGEFPDDPQPKLQPWWVQRQNLFGSIDFDKGILTLIVSLLVLVSTLNVAATLVILFLERDRDLAILRALGLSRWQMIQWTGIIGLLVGCTASFLGLGLGRLFGWALSVLPWAKLPAEVYRISELPMNFLFYEQLLVFLFGAVATTLAALALGIRLSRQSYLEVLGHRL